MKHYSGASPPIADLISAADLRRTLAARLNGTAEAKAALAAELGLSEFQLSHVVRNGRGLAALAVRLGYRKVVRFERVGSVTGPSRPTEPVG